MVLRKLKIEDAPYMYEWLTAKDINNYFKIDSSKITLESCEEFIKNSFNEENKNFAIVDENDEYVGTISLKHIDLVDKNAEFAIAIREKYRGKGYGTMAIKELFDYAFSKIKLNKIYLNVLSDNINAIKLYEKVGFKYEGELKKHILINGEYRDLKLYGVWKSSMDKTIKLIDFQYCGDERGSLVVLEQSKSIPFETKRIFYIYGVSDEKSRGNHANIDSEFVMVAITGSVTVDIDDGFNKYIYVLDNPSQGLYLPNLTWKSMYNFSPDAVLMVIASTLYNKDEYINDYDEFKEYVRSRK